jgi:hypothetical protein
MTCIAGYSLQEDKMVYFAIKDGEAIHHRDLKAMKEWEGVKNPLATMTEAEFLSYDNLVRVIDGKLFFGKTPKEKLDEAANLRITEIDAELKKIDLKSGERATRDSIKWLKEKFGEEFDIAAAGIVDEWEAKAVTFREERQQLKDSLEIPY